MKALKRPEKPIVYRCVVCGAGLETETSDQDAARLLLRRMGGEMRLLAETWVFFCPKCK